MVLTTIKLFSLVIAVWFTEVNILKACRGNTVSKENFVIQSLSIVIFLALQFNLF